MTSKNLLMSFSCGLNGSALGVGVHSKIFWGRSAPLAPTLTTFETEVVGTPDFLPNRSMRLPKAPTCAERARRSTAGAPTALRCTARAKESHEKELDSQICRDLMEVRQGIQTWRLPWSPTVGSSEATRRSARPAQPE